MGDKGWNTRESSGEEAAQGLVLVVTAEPSIAELLKQVLHLDGLAVEAVSGAEAARQALEQSRPSVVIVDLDGSVPNDRALIDLLGDWHSAVPIVTLSAEGSKSDFARALPGARHLRKPFDIDDVLNAVRELGQGGGSFRSRPITPGAG